MLLLLLEALVAVTLLWRASVSRAVRLRVKLNCHMASSCHRAYESIDPWHCGPFTRFHRLPREALCVLLTPGYDPKASQLSGTAFPAYQSES